MAHPNPCILCMIKGFRSRLENWKITKDPWRDSRVVRGNIYDDDRWDKEEWGKQIWTTEIQWIDEHHLRTRNTNYILGKKEEPTEEDYEGE